jgi:serine-aspartate repeat-containing protein C/D/E
VFKDGRWFIDLNDNGVWDEGDLWAKLGHKGDRPVTGDWDGDGKTDIGIYGPAWAGDPRAVAHEPGLPDPHNENTDVHKNVPRQPNHSAVGERTMKLTAEGKARADLIDHVFFYGTPGDHPVVGDWNGDGTHTIAVFRDGVWRRDTDGDGKWSKADVKTHFGQKGDLPVAGDFNGDGVDELGVYRDGTWLIDTNGNGLIDAEDQVFHLGSAGDIPIVGDWNGDGVAEPGVYHGSSAPLAQAPAPTK